MFESYLYRELISDMDRIIDHRSMKWPPVVYTAAGGILFRILIRELEHRLRILASKEGHSYVRLQLVAEDLVWLFTGEARAVVAFHRCPDEDTPPVSKTIREAHIALINRYRWVRRSLPYFRDDRLLDGIIARELFRKTPQISHSSRMQPYRELVFVTSEDCRSVYKHLQTPP